MSKSHYEIVGAPATATAAELRRAYLVRARRLHPDQYADRPAAERARAERGMQELNASWSVLSDPEARRAYDLSLSRRMTPRGTGRVVSGRGDGWSPFDPAREPQPRRPRGPVVADEREMEIRGPAKLLRPFPLLAIFAGTAALIAVATLLSGGGDGVPADRTTPVEQPTGVPIGCIDLLPVAESVPCGAHDAVVWSVVDGTGTCPPDLEAVYRPQVGGLFCVTRAG